MVGHLAERICPAQSRARVHALHVAALLGGRTVRVDEALGAARHVGVAKVLGNALAGSGPVYAAPGVAHSIGAAGCWVAGVYFFHHGSRYEATGSSVKVFKKNLIVKKGKK
jgi:hypothetical protein